MVQKTKLFSHCTRQFQSTDWVGLTSTVGAVPLEVLVTGTGEAAGSHGALGCRVAVVVLWVTENWGKK